MILELKGFIDDDLGCVSKGPWTLKFSKGVLLGLFNFFKIQKVKIEKIYLIVKCVFCTF